MPKIESKAPASHVLEKKAPPAKAPLTLKKAAVRDELSTGRGQALRKEAQRTLGANSLATLLPARVEGGIRVNAFGQVTGTSSPAEKVKAALAKDGPKAAAAVLAAETILLSPAEAKAVYDAVKPSIDALLEKVGPLSKEDTKQTILALATAAEAAGPEAVADLAQHLAKAIPNGKVGDYDDAISAAIRSGVDPALALATIEALNAAGKPKGAADIEAALIDGIDKLQGDAGKAAAEKAELDARLAEDFATFGNAALTEDQRKQYEAEFWALPEHAAVKAAAERTAKDLQQAIEVAGPKLEALAKAGNPAAALALLESYEQLAKYPETAEAAIAYAAKLGSDDALKEVTEAAIKFLDGDFNPEASLEDRLGKTLLPAATQALQTKLLADYAGDPDGQQKVLDQLKRIFADFKNAKAFKKLGKEVSNFLDDTQAIITDPKSAEKLAADFGKKSPFGKSLAVFTVVTGIFNTKKNLENGDYLKALASGLAATKDGLELTAGILGAYSSAAKASANAANFLRDFTPGISAVLDVIQLTHDIDELRTDPNAGEFIKAAGTILQLAGDFIPVAGVVLDAGGAVLRLIGGLIDSIIEGNDKLNALRDEQAALFAKVTGLTVKEAKEVVKADPQLLTQLTQLGFTPEQIRAVAKNPNIVLNGPEAFSAIQAAALFGLDPAETVKFIEMQDGLSNQYIDQLFFDPTATQEELDLLNSGDLSAFQASVLERLGYTNPEMAAFLEEHAGTASYDTVFPNGWSLYENY